MSAGGKPVKRPPIDWMGPWRDAREALWSGGASRTRGAVHLRDAISLQRVQVIWLLALLPATLFGIYNTGLQANLALNPEHAATLEGWRYSVLRNLGVGLNPESIAACFWHGLMYFAPLLAVVWIVGRGWDWLFAALRGRRLDEGFWVIALIFPLLLPPAIPLWQVALAVSWGMVIAHLVFGGTGMNILHPALVGRAFLFYAYPAQILGNGVWVATPEAARVDGFSGATPLVDARTSGDSFAEPGAWWNAFVGLEPGSLGETSALACLIGAVILLATRTASWRIMAGVTLGTVAAALIFNSIGSETNPAFALPFWWHMVIGGWAFAAVFLATDPTTSSFTQRGRWIYGVCIGLLIVTARVVNPAFPDSTMLVILFMNVFAPLIDHFVARSNRRRRLQRHAH